MVKRPAIYQSRLQVGGGGGAATNNFKTMTVADMTELRGSLEKAAKRTMVLKHTFAKKVFTERKFNDAEKFLKSSVLVTFCDKDPQIISKALVKFAKGNKKLVPSGVIFEDKVYGSDFVERLSKLPSRQELLTQMVVRVKSPISGLVMTLGQVMRGFVVALNQIKDKKQAQAA